MPVSEFYLKLAIISMYTDVDKYAYPKDAVNITFVTSVYIIATEDLVFINFDTTS